MTLLQLQVLNWWSFSYIISVFWPTWYMYRPSRPTSWFYKQMRIQTTWKNTKNWTPIHENL